MQISVIIPVFNAAAFVEKAVESALMQQETGEVILIEDGSPDNSLKICQRLAGLFGRVALFQHPDGKNHGAGASRNLGITKARFPYIAFLDADDFYMSARFKRAKQIFQEKEDADGVYEAIGVHFYSQEGKNQFERLYGKEYFLTTVSISIPPEKLFNCLIEGKKGWFSLNGLVLKKSSINQVGLFNEILRQGQDTDFIWRLAMQLNLYPGSLTQPIAMRGVHNDNRILNRRENSNSRFLLFQKWYLSMLELNFEKHINRIIYNNFISNHPFVLFFSKQPFLRKISKIFIGTFWLIRKPSTLEKLIR